MNISAMYVYQNYPSALVPLQSSTKYLYTNKDHSATDFFFFESINILTPSSTRLTSPLNKLTPASRIRFSLKGLPFSLLQSGWHFLWLNAAAEALFLFFSFLLSHLSLQFVSPLISVFSPFLFSSSIRLSSGFSSGLSFNLSSACSTPPPIALFSIDEDLA